MSDWAEELAAAEVEADRFEAAEGQAEEQFRKVRTEAEKAGNSQLALQSPEFDQWMRARRATDLAWSSWALLKGGKSSA
jgi:hypothetical protein